MWSIYMLKSSWGKAHLLHLPTIIKILFVNSLQSKYITHLSALPCSCFSNLMSYSAERPSDHISICRQLDFSQWIFTGGLLQSLKSKKQRPQILQTNRADFQHTEPSQLCQSQTPCPFWLTLTNDTSLLKTQVFLLNIYGNTVLNFWTPLKATNVYTAFCLPVSAAEPQSIISPTVLYWERNSENTLLGVISAVLFRYNT